MKYFRLFEKLCGGDFSNIVLMTTMWDGVNEQVGTVREQELMNDYWRPMIECGALVKRFLYTRDSAFEVLSPFFAEVQRRSVLHLQNEIGHCRLLQNRPSATEALQVELGELAVRHERVLGRMQRGLREISDPDQLRGLMEDYRTACVRLQRPVKVLKGNRVCGLTIPVHWFGLSRLVFISCIPL